MGCPENNVCTGYELVSDLSFDTNNSGGADAGDAYWNNRQGWAPIGDYGATFEGYFHAMSSLYIDRASERNVGLFSQINDSGNIRNVRLYKISVTGGRNSGGLVANNRRGAITASYWWTLAPGNPPAAHPRIAFVTRVPGLPRRESACESVGCQYARSTATETAGFQTEHNQTTFSAESGG